MELTDYIRILRKNWVIIVVAVLFLPRGVIPFRLRRAP